MAKSKNDPFMSNMPKNAIGNKIDIITGTEPKKETQNNRSQQLRKKTVALKDSSQSGNVPRVVASGQGTFAEQILQIAWANNIKVREDADLVEILSAIDVDSEIPIEAFAAVAEILGYVYRANAGETPIPELNELKEK